MYNIYILKTNKHKQGHKHKQGQTHKQKQNNILFYINKFIIIFVKIN